METLKAGCFLVDVKSRSVALVYRRKQKDFSFPKGHLEVGETLQECAKRETEEETKRSAEIIADLPPYVERYTTSSGEKCACYMFFAKDVGKSDNASTDFHDTIFVPFEEIKDKLSYPSLKHTWNDVKDIVESLFNQK